MASANGRRGDSGGLLAVTGFLVLLASPAVADPVIETSRKADGSYQLTLKADEAIGVEEGQALLLSTAVRLCDGLPPRLGEYWFSKTEGVDGPGSDESFFLEQEIECGGTGRVEEKPRSRALGDRERAEIEQAARVHAAAYFVVLARGDFRAAHAVHADFLASISASEDWDREQAAFRAKAGALRKIDVWQGTVYVDPPGAEEPGIYVATDFEVSYENLVACGYLVWLEGPEGTLRIVRTDVGQLETEVVAGMSDSQLADVKRRFRCRPDGPSQ